MWRTIASRRSLVSPAAIILMLVALLGGYLIISRAAPSSNPYVLLPGSALNVPTNGHLVGQHNSQQQISISVALHPNNEAQMNALLTALYDPSSPQYHHWLAQGQFNARFAPTSAQIKQVQNFLTQAGLHIVSSSTPFLVRAIGTTAQIEAAFHISLTDYNVNGQTIYQNNTAVQIPSNLSNVILAVTGLTNSVKVHPDYILPKSANGTVPQYGAGPGGSGLTPSQLISLYGGTGTQALGSRGQGKGATLAVFELSGYTESDITHFEHQFFGNSENVSIQNINVDGGPVTPQCPAGDSCGPFDGGPCANGCDKADFSGDIEVEADIETQIAMAPKVSHLLVYNAPNDELGQTELDEYSQIAADDRADSISSSWGLCAPAAGFEYAVTESIIFGQMAAQGQSMFASAGDAGAYDCVRTFGPGASISASVQVDDPSSQPFVTSVGGTSFGTYDPQSTQHPSYPAGAETVWNPLGLCRGLDVSPNGLNDCLNFGAGGGGVSQFWGQPSFQKGPGVIQNGFSEKAPFCQAAGSGQFCREVPDVSANADEFTPYAEFCTGDPNTNSECASFSGGQPAPGWFGIGGTSLSSPLWSGIIALWDGVHGERFGSASLGLYRILRSSSYSQDFHDINGFHQSIVNNGFYPVTTNYDMATGIGTPHIDGLMLSRP